MLFFARLSRIIRTFVPDFCHPHPKGWSKWIWQRQIRYSEVAECQCNMDTVLDGNESFVHRILRSGVPLLCLQPIVV